VESSIVGHRADVGRDAEVSSVSIIGDDVVIDIGTRSVAARIPLNFPDNLPENVPDPG
jgi:hypothetical protein